MHISFSEILLVLLIALLVIKPDRLPGVATKLGQWIRNLQTLSAKIKNEIDKPMSKYSYHEKQEEGSDS